MGSNSSEQTAGNRRFAWTVILAILAVLVAILGGAYTVWRLSARESYETSHPQRAVNVSLTAEDYEPSEDGPTPLRVKGTTSDGEEVNGYALVKTELCNLMLEPGSYEIGVAGPVIGPDGTLYRAPEGVLKITVPTSGATTPIGFELTVADPDSVTATDAYEAYDTLLRAGADDEMSRELRAAANDRYQTTEQEEPDEKDEPAAPHDAEGQGAPSRDSEAQGSEPQASSFPFTPNCKLDKESGEILQGLARVVAWWRSESVDDIMRDLLVRLYCRRIEDVQRESFYSGLVFLWNKLFRIEKEGRAHVVHSLAEGKEALEGMISFWAYAGEAHTRSHITNYLYNKCNITGLSAIDDENTLRQAFLALFVGFSGRTHVDFREREMRFLY